MKADALCVADYIAAQHAGLYLVGRSIGSAFALHVAARREIKKNILITPFDSIARLAKDRYGIFPIDWILKDRFESWQDASAINSPTLVIKAEQDKIVPSASTQSLLEHLPNAVTTVESLPEAGHNHLEELPQYWYLLRSYFRP